MSASLGILSDIRTAITTASVADRGTLLRSVTDLFLVRSDGFPDDDIMLFDDIFNRLVAEIEVSARALLAMRLAPVSQAPRNIIRTLAFDPEIDVAGPVLTSSERLDDQTLVENATRMSQSHLFAISRRRVLNTSVTDVLVERGDAQVALSVAQNAGAAFSEAGFKRLVDRTEGDDALAATVGIRTDIPWHHFANLLAKASSQVRAKLEARQPHARAEIKQAVDAASANVAEKYRDAVSSMTGIEASLAEMHRVGQLDDEQIRCFAEDGLVEEVTVSLCLLADLPKRFIEEALDEDSGEMLLVLARATGLSWATAQRIMQTRTGRCLTHSELRQRLARYEKLGRTTAEQIVRFHRNQAR